MTQLSGHTRWHLLPGPRWSEASEARLWLKREREALGWSEKQVEKAFWDTAASSYLFIGVGGGAVFDRATAARVRRFESRGDTVPDWVFWIPLAIERSKIPGDLQAEWDRANVPDTWEEHLEKQQDEFHSHTPYLADVELELLQLARNMSDTEHGILMTLARNPQFFPFIQDAIIQAVDRELDK